MSVQRDLPKVACEQCGEFDYVTLHVVPHGELTSEYRYCCQKCGHPLLIAVLGLDEEVNRVQRDLAAEGYRYGVEIHDVEISEHPR
jgi:hypothetical protein